MSLKTFKPDTPGKRGLVQVDRSLLWKGKPEKALTVGLKKTGGRNNTGRITSWHKGGGHKRSYRLVDFKRQRANVSAVVERIEYDPNRTAFIALIRYSDNVLSYILAPNDVKVGDTIISGEGVDVRPGNAMPLKNVPMGTLVHNIELHPGDGGRFARASGAFARVVAKTENEVRVQLPSRKEKKRSFL